MGPGKTNPYLKLNHLFHQSVAIGGRKEEGEQGGPRDKLGISEFFHKGDDSLVSIIGRVTQYYLVAFHLRTLQFLIP